MADTVDLDDIDEVVEPRAVFDAKCAAFADLVKSAKRIVVFTGAGVSTSVGIPGTTRGHAVEYEVAVATRGRGWPSPSRRHHLRQV